MDSVVHFEVPAKDMDRMKKFYAETFGWTSQTMEIDGESYTTAMTCECGEDTRPKEKGMINGGFVNFGETGDDSPHTMIVINVKDIKEKLEMVKANGGEILGEIRQWGNFGLYSKIKDSEGNLIGVWQDLHNNRKEEGGDVEASA